MQCLPKLEEYNANKMKMIEILACWYSTDSTQQELLGMDTNMIELILS